MRPIQKLRGSVSTPYATEEDAQGGVNPLPETTIVTESGTYYITQTINECESEPFTVAVEILLGTSDFEKSKIMGYPNPVKNILTLVPSTEIDYLEVYDLLGQKVINKAVYENDLKIDMSLLSSGTYVVKVLINGQSIPFKIIKE